MLGELFQILTLLDSLFWANIAFILIMSLGGYLTIRMRFFQLRIFPAVCRNFWGFLGSRSQGKDGVHPLRVFFASVGGMIGIGNIVGIVTALQIGGPGALFWVWVATVCGSIIKYAEILLGLKYRVRNDQGGYDGGPILFLKKAFKNPFIPALVAVLLCIYGVEIYQFSILTDCIVSNSGLHRYGVIALLLGLVMLSGMGGVKRIGKICSYAMPFFVLVYLTISLIFIGCNIDLLPGVLKSVFVSAFSGHAAIGGFIGGSAWLAIQHGIARAAYSSDLGIGYDSIIQSESNTVYVEKQASMAILGVFIDSLVCTMSLLIVLLSGLWAASPTIPASEAVQVALSQVFPYMHVFMPIFIVIVGFTTIIAYFCVGLKCSRFLSPRYGEKIYLGYAIFSFIFFSFFDPSKALLMMSISGALLLIINLLGIFRLRDEISYSEEKRDLHTTA